MLPVDEDLPRVVDVVCKINPGAKDYPGSDSLQLDGLLPKPYVGSLFLDGNGVNKPPLHDHTLWFLFNDSFLMDGSPVNQCVRHITNGAAPIKWAGMIMVFRLVGGARTKPWTERYEDLPMEEFMNIGVEFLKTHDS